MISVTINVNNYHIIPNRRALQSNRCPPPSLDVKQSMTIYVDDNL